MQWRLKRPRHGLWGHPDFMKLWAGQTISEFGTPVSQIAIPWIAIKNLNESAFAVASLTTVQFLPFLLFTLPAGVWVDRLSRRMVLIVGDLGRAVLLLTIPLAYAFDALSLTQLYVVSFLVGILTVFFDVAYQSYLPYLVERDQLVEGNSKLQITVSAAQGAGPAIGGGLIQAFTAPYAVFVDAFSFVASGAFSAAIKKQEQIAARVEGARQSMWAELKEGLAYVLRHPYLRPQAMCTSTSNFFGSMSFAILLVYAARAWHMSAAVVGLGLGLGSVGWLLGAVFVGRLQARLGVGTTTLVACVLFGVPWLLIPFAPHSFPLPFLVAAILIGGFGGVVYNVTQVSLRQAITPERLQGRMNAVMRFIVWGALPLGSLVGGALASTIGLRNTLIVSAVGATFAILPIWFSPIRSLREIPEPEPPAEPRLEPGLATPLQGPLPAMEESSA
jgi:MFS family permease